MGIYFRNTNAMSPIIRYTDDNKSILSYISTGGTIEIYFMFKGTAKQIISQYQNLIGKPSLPPMWSLGWHASAYAYKTLADVKENIEGYKNANIPLEGIWFDIPYMSGFSDFSINQTAFPDVKAFADEIHANG